ncbi:MAG: Phosphodiesterase YfcE [Syntrophorhabdaceae bacterium PtaU1.Bin034]|jgi:putative phosphoesterase|nr:MAG: Phosphodiesterase YfcE [Syntrophorhabdaceae bacterium PtaU1.Bin034]
MKIGLISDTHGSVKGFQRVLEGPFKDVEMILHAGDVLYHGAKNPLSDGYNTVALAEKINNLSIPIMIAKGNCDSDVDQLVLNTPIMSPYVFLYVDRKRLMVVHGDNKKDRDLEELVEKFRLSVLVHGHSHTPRIKKIGESLIVNPGTPTIPNPSSPFKKTAGVLDCMEGRVEIWDIENMEVVLRDTFGP